MNKKLLFGIMSLAALAACTNDDFDSQQQVAEGTSPIQFEVINNNASMRASMDGNKVKWSAKDGDLFTLYHGAAITAGPTYALMGYENATYKANAVDGGTAVLTTPSVIKEGAAVMVWPVDSTFSIKSTDNLSIKIDQDQEADIENHIPYMSDLFEVKAYAAHSETAPAAMPTAYNTAGYARKYPVYMRPMASQLIITADYANTDATLKTLEEGQPGVDAGEGIDPISVTSVEILTSATGSTKFTTKVPVKFTNPTTAISTQWAGVEFNNWKQVVDYDVTGIATTDQVSSLTTECINGTESAKLLMLPQATVPATGIADAGVVVNTTYGKVYITAPTAYPATYPAASQYNASDIADAWYRITNSAVTTPFGTGTTIESPSTTAETVGKHAGKFKTTADINVGMGQVIDAFNKHTQSDGVTKGEPSGAAGTRYVKVLLTKLNMDDLHIKTDKQLRNAARVWQKMGLADVTVYLDGDATTGEFEISQKTIKVINDINAAVAGKDFKVKPCTVGGEACTDIVVTGGGNLQDIAFIEDNAGTKVNVVLNAGETWKWNVNATTKIGSVKVQSAAVTRFINKGTLVSDADATLKTYEKNGTTQNNVPLRNDGTWNVTGGKLFVQFTTTNNGGATLNISSGAEYRQDGAGHIFYNWASNKPSRFGGDDTKIGVVNNKGVFATVNNGVINNYGLIEHDDVNAKTYITANQVGGNFNTAFNVNTNKMGRINLKYSNKDEDNISISGAALQGFVSVTVDGEVTGELNTSAVGTYVNYMIINSGVTTISTLPAQIKYVEIADRNNTEIAWSLPTATPTASYLGLMVLSPVNIKLGTTIQIWDGTTPGTGACYLGADMYVGGTFNNGAAGTLPSWSGYYGNTTSSFATKYVTY